MNDILDREDLDMLISTFYGQIRKDSLLGPVFNLLIKEASWPDHLIRMVDFWECNLFFRPTFKGNPLKIHQKVDEDYHFQTHEPHYKRWTELWCETVDRLFRGERAELAKIRAIKMGKVLLSKVMEAKPSTAFPT
jgi:hemoglobin